MAIYRGKGGKTDVIPADGDQEFAGSIIAEKDIHAHGNISADGDITIGGDLHWEGVVTGDGSGLENVPTPFLQADDCIYLNNQVISNDYTMPVGKNGMTAGDVTVNGEVEIPLGSDWHIVGDDDGVVTLEALGIPNHDLVTVDETGHLTTFGVTSESPYVGDGSLLTGIPTETDLDEIESQVVANKTGIETNAEAIQNNADAIQANTDAINAIPEGVDAYTKAEIDAQQAAQDTAIDANTANIDAVETIVLRHTDEIDILEADIEQNKTSIEALNGEIAGLTGSVIYKGSLNATITSAPEENLVGDMWINNYNADDPTTNYPVASGWGPVTEVKYDDKLIRTDTGWDKIESVVGIPSYTAGEIDELLDDKADKTDVYTKEEVDNAQDLQDAEIAKKADKEDTYTKDEVDELIESSSGAIVANYTNKWTDSVARDPEAGNLYLVYGMNFSSKYNEVTKIYISDTDGAGEVRDFDEIKENDKIKLSSENGSGEYTIVGTSDVGGYRELVVDLVVSDGTISNDSAVSIVLDVASSGGESGGIEEAPADGKQYARQDEAWTEVTASSGGSGGDVEAQPPVAFSVKASDEQTLVSSQEAQIVYDNATLDTNSAWDTNNNHYVVPQDGIMSLQASVLLASESFNFDYAYLRIYKNDSVVQIAHVNPSDPANRNVRSMLVPISATLSVTKGDTLSVKVLQHGAGVLYTSLTGNTFSGHFVSSSVSGGAAESWTPHNYVYVKNTDPSSPQAPLPGEVYFAGEGAPLADENYSSLRTMIISKFDQDGRELPFPNTDGFPPEIKISSANGKGRFYISYGINSDNWDPLGGDNETYYTLEFLHPLDTQYNTITEGTLSEGETLQIETAEEGYEVEWIEKDITSPEQGFTQSVTVPYTEVKYNNISLNGLFVGMTSKDSPYNNVSNIIIGEKPYPDTRVDSEHIPGLYWNSSSTRDNIAIGNNGFRSITYGTDNIAIGSQGLPTLTYGSSNTVVGQYAGNGMTSGDNNIFIGYAAEPILGLAEENGEVNNQVVLGNQQTQTLYLGDKQIYPFPDDLGGGGGGSASGDSIWTEEDGKAVYDGDIKVNGLTIGKGSENVLTNTAFGVNALANAEDSQNTAVGFSALSNLIAGGSNTAIGVDAGKLLTIGDNNIIIGNDAQPSESVVNNEVTIGNREIKKTRLMGAVEIKGMQNGGGVAPNVHIASDGVLYSTATTYMTEEEVDKKLAIKDKLIEKLSARLDELEKRMK